MTIDKGRGIGPAGAIRRRVLFMDHTAQLSGGELALLSLVKELDQKKYEPIVLLFQNGPLEEKLRAYAQVEILPLASSVRDTRKDSLGWSALFKLTKIFIIIGFVGRLAKKVKALSPDIIHTNSLKADVLGGIAAKFTSTPVIWHVRDRIDNDYLPRQVVRLFRFISRVVPNGIIANSKSTLYTLKLPKRKTSWAIPSGFNTADFQNKSSNSESLSVALKNKTTIRIGLVGRISPWKGQDVFLKAAATVSKEFPNAHFYLIGAPLFGEDSYLASLKQLAENLGVGNVTVFSGFKADVASAMKDLHIVVHASKIAEPFGQVIAQGMTAGKPVIATRGGGVPEIVTHEKTGLLVPPQDDQALAGAILSLLKDPERAEQMAKNGQLSAIKQFSADLIARRIEAVYDELLFGNTQQADPVRHRILHYNTTANVSGAEGVLIQILGNLDRSRFESIVVCPEGKLADKVQGMGVQVIKLRELEARFTGSALKFQRYIASIFFTAVNLRRIVRELNPGVIHANSVRAGIVATLATIGMRKPVEWHIHDTLPDHPISLLVRLLAASSKRNSFIAVSSATLSSFCGMILKKRLWNAGTVIINGVDVDRYKPNSGTRAAMREQLAIAEDQFCIAHVGQVIPRKGQLGAVHAFLTVRKSIPNAVLLMVGTPMFESGIKYADEIREFIESTDLDNSVRLLGYRNDIPKIMQTCDLLVMNSLSDPCPLTVLEAMASETAILASNVDGIPELIQHESTGWLTKPNMPDNLAKDILKIAAMPVEHRLQIAHNARLAAENRHSLGSYIEQFEVASLIQIRRFSLNQHLASQRKKEIPGLPLEHGEQF